MNAEATSQRQSIWQRLAVWWSKPASDEQLPPASSKKIDWVRGVPFLLMHVLCLGVIIVGWSPVALAMAALFYAVRMFAVTGFYHRYFSHRTFKTSRVCQFIFGVFGCLAMQRGPLWWAAHHRHHHAHSDDELDLHSPRCHGFWFSHLFWFLTPQALPTKHKFIPDLAKYPELRLLDRFEVVIPMLLAAGMFGFGVLLNTLYPHLGTSGLQMLVWGFLISTVLVYHATYLVNSAAHRVGTRRFDTKDDSRNSFWIAILTFGEGWHNNHHHYPNSARQGFYWWEVDITYYLLRLMSWCGLIWELRPVPGRVLNVRKIKKRPKARMA